MKKFCVVNFVEGDSVEAVPCSWMVGDFCFWPPAPKLKKLIKNPESTPSANWTQFKIRKLHEYGKQ